MITFRCYVAVVISINLLSPSFSFQNPIINFSGRKISRQDHLAIIMASNEKNDVSTAPTPLLISLRDRLSAESMGKDEVKKACLVLASQSPRRRYVSMMTLYVCATEKRVSHPLLIPFSEILDMMGLAGLYSCEPPPLDESAVQEELMKQDLHPTIYTKKLAEAKAHSLAAKYATIGRKSDFPVYFLGSDTVVDIDDRILEKPKSEEEATKMLRKLSGEEVSFVLLVSWLLVAAIWSQSTISYLISCHEAPSSYWCCSLSAFSRIPNFAFVFVHGECSRDFLQLEPC